MINYTVFSYVILAVIGFAAYRHYTGGKKAPPRLPDARAPPPRKEKPAKKPREKKAAPSPAPAPAPASTTSYKRVNDSSDDGVDNKEFARQLTLAKTGTKVTGKKADDKKIKSVKQSRAQEKPQVEKESAPSSTAGIDADDDQSAEQSPSVQAADGTGVSDMLEPQAPGPSVLRLTDTDKEKAQKGSKKTKSPEPALTKKQRQNKRKAELKKAEREEEEAERKEKLESQRRTARMAEGRAAQDGTQFMAAQANSAWNPKKEDTNGTPTPLTAPLDTFDQESAKQSSTSDEWIKTLPTEEEQIERVLQEAAEDEWSTVESKATKRKQQRKEAGTQSPTMGASSSRPEPSSAKAFATQSSFAALNTGSDSTDESEYSSSKKTQSTPAGKMSSKAPSSKAQQVEVEWDI